MTTEDKAEAVRELLNRDGATRPFWTTESGPGGQCIRIVCQDLKMLHALDDYLQSCVRDANL